MNNPYTVLLEEKEILQKVEKIAKQINQDYEGKDIVMIAIANGSFVFAADLLRKLKGDILFDTVKASSYRGTTSGEPVIKNTFNIDLTGKHIILVDDILDTSKTMMKVREHIISFSPLSLRICVLLDKPSSRTNGFKADYCGFTVPDLFVFGYGLDNEFGLGRNIPDIVAKVTD